MKAQNFPNCCTARIVYDFGGTRLSGMDTEPTNENVLKRQIKDEMRWSSRGRLFVAITNSDQKTAAKVLRELGFSHSKWLSKAQHSETKMRLWWKQA